jgi:hypothetical protein
MKKARRQLTVLFNHGITKDPKMPVPSADKRKRKCDSAQPKRGSCSYSSLVLSRQFVNAGGEAAYRLFRSL